MSAPIGDTDPFAHAIDPSVSCTHCEAVCCRLTVVLAPDDVVAEEFIAHNADGVAVMARGADGWCSALDRTRMCCGIYEKRPGVCRKFAMGGPYCRAERENYERDKARGIPPQLR
ncbi:MAG TPA: YkgJ family cysteine cluster protein [Dokdonella sp.]